MDLIRFCKDLYKFPRSITGKGIKDTLIYIKKIIPIEIKKVKSGTKAFDWIVPPEWNIKSGYIIDLNSNKKIIDFKNHNLHVVSYSEPVNKVMNFNQLEQNLYYIKEIPHAIPYVTSYYSRRWGFCLAYNDFKKINKKSKFKVVIDSVLNDSGELNYGEIYIKGESEKEIFLSTYICHPQMVNNELSGPAVLTHIVKKLLSNNNYFSYRVIFIPETIGSIVYLSKNLDHLKKNVIAGFNVTCVGDNRMWGFVPTRYGNSISDKVALYVLKKYIGDFKKFSWLDRGSDERQFCSPGIDLPICCITRSKWDEYPEYHTSDDNFDLVTNKSLNESLEIYLKCIDVIEKEKILFPIVTVMCEPQLGKRGLQHTIKTSTTSREYRSLKNFISYCDGTNTIDEIAVLVNISREKATSFYNILRENKLVRNFIR